MNDALVDRITQEVLEVYRRTAPRTDNPKTVTFSYGDHPLVGVCGSPATRKDAVAAFTTIRKLCPGVKVLLSQAASRIFTDSKRVFGGLTVEPSARDYAETLGRFSQLIVLNTSIHFVAKAAMLMADSPLVVAVFDFLAAGKPVLVCTGALDAYTANPAIKARVDDYLQTLSSYGVTLVPGNLPDATADKPGLGAVAGGPPAGLKRSECTGCPSAGHCGTHCGPRVEEFVSVGAARIAAAPGIPTVGQRIGAMIDHTLLKADATDDEVRKLCEEARQHTFASVCVNPSKVRLSAELLKGCPVKVCTVIGFPLGATTSVTKEMETRDAVANGADEIDMVINVGALKAKDHGKVKEDIEAVVRGAGGRCVKVILETSLLDDEEKVVACRLAKEAGADFVKTSTGFGGGGATVHDIELMRRTVGPDMGVKASGGIRDFDTARKMIEAGATRLGASASVAIVKNKGPAAPSKGY